MGEQAAISSLLTALSFAWGCGPSSQLAAALTEGTRAQATAGRRLRRPWDRAPLWRRVVRR